MKRMMVAVLALVAMPALAAAQDTTRQQIDSGRTNMQRQAQSGRRTGRGSMGLSHDQVMQLQTALSGAGCDAGTADGILGPKTRRAMACARKKNNVTTNAELYRSLNLDFETSGREPSRGAHERSTETRDTQGAAADNPAARATHGDSSQVGGRNRGRIRPTADSVRKSRHDSTSH
jgi:peptidoglycan hydrolase-like protein with peptidoglycan-binding domain